MVLHAHRHPHRPDGNRSASKPCAQPVPTKGSAPHFLSAPGHATGTAIAAEDGWQVQPEFPALPSLLDPLNLTGR